MRVETGGLVFDASDKQFSIIAISPQIYTCLIMTGILGVRI